MNPTESFKITFINVVKSASHINYMPYLIKVKNNLIHSQSGAGVNEDDFEHHYYTMCLSFLVLINEPTK